MFGIGSWEFIVIVVLAVLLFGPDKLPEFARTLGRFMRDFRRYQSMMESTIKAEMFAVDPKLQRDPFKTAKDFGDKVASGTYSKQSAPGADAADAPSDEAALAESESAAGGGDSEPPATGRATGISTPEDDLAVEADAASARAAERGEVADPAADGAAGSPEPVTEDGEEGPTGA